MSANNSVKTAETDKQIPCLATQRKPQHVHDTLLQDSLNQKGPEIKTRYSQNPLPFLFSRM